MGSRATPPPGPRWPVAAVARRLGVAPSTLRTWDRRYGLGPSEHVAGAHRRYTASDLARLDTMRRLTLAGLPPAEAARAALAAQSAEPDVAAVADAEPLPDREGGLIATGRGGPGGRVLAVPGADAAVRGLSRAVLALDASTTTAGLRALVAERGVLPTWDGVLRPLLVAVGARWAGTGEGVEAEHLLSECATTVLREVSAAISEPPDTRPVLLACAPDDLHALPLHAVAAGLAERGVAARVLGAALPAEALAAAVRRTGPAALLLWSQLPSTAAADVLAALPVTRPATVLLAGGPGWKDVELPRRVTVAHDLPHALSLVDRALGAA
jgi:DNA-binding transcriptional MerR regulator